MVKELRLKSSWNWGIRMVSGWGALTGDYGGIDGCDCKKKVAEVRLNTRLMVVSS